jgi:methylthioribose-1-phosphate isomerase
MNFKTLQWIGGVDGCLELIDQRKLPTEFTHIQCKTIEQLFDAIKTLAVRGAPAIGVAAGYGVCIAAQHVDNNTPIQQAVEHIIKQADFLVTSRPTAVNLFWAINRMKIIANSSTTKTISQLKNDLLAEAHKICTEDIEMCKAIGQNGAKFIKDGYSVLTHCNAGALATAGQGTALSIMYEAKNAGTNFKVYVDETRPLLQGARLTAWELSQENIEAVLVCDNMAGALMQAGKIDCVITGADRVAANGDAANKIGTYALSVLAKAHNVPFYIAAPSSTFDMSIKTGDEIPIEERPADEVAGFGGLKTAPDDIKVFNPAFDVTPAKNITAIITERGVIDDPSLENIKNHLC